jgi:hypothetical protein
MFCISFQQEQCASAHLRSSYHKAEQLTLSVRTRKGQSRFRARVAQARGSLREGRGVRIEELREKYGGEPNTEMESPEEEG